MLTPITVRLLLLYILSNVVSSFLTLVVLYSLYEILVYAYTYYVFIYGYRIR